MEEGVIDRALARNLDDPNMVGLTFPRVQGIPEIVFIH
jgi:hypothetical protein